MVYKIENNPHDQKIEDILNSWYNEVDKFNSDNVDRYRYVISKLIEIILKILIMFIV